MSGRAGLGHSSSQQHCLAAYEQQRLSCSKGPAAVCRARASVRPSWPARKTLFVACISTPAPPAPKVDPKRGRLRYPRGTRGAWWAPLAVASVEAVVLTTLLVVGVKSGMNFINTTFTAAQKGALDIAVPLTLFAAGVALITIMSHGLSLATKLWLAKQETQRLAKQQQEAAEQRRQALQKPLGQWAQEEELDDVLKPAVVERLCKEGFTRIGRLAKAASNNPEYVQRLLCGSGSKEGDSSNAELLTENEAVIVINELKEFRVA